MTRLASASRSAFLVFATIAAIVGGVAIFLGWRSSVQNRTLLDRGSATFGEVTSRERKDAIRGSDDFVVRYSYADRRGGLHTGQMSVSREAWEGFDVGTRVPVTFLPDDPTVHVPRHLAESARWRPLWSALGFAAGTVGVTLLVGGVGFLTVRPRGTHH